MNVEEAIEIADLALYAREGQYMSDLERTLLEGAWHGWSYAKIAAAHQYTQNYLQRDVAPQLWKRLSSALGEEVSKKNFKAALDRYAARSSSLAEVTDSSVLYVERLPIESNCYREITKAGALVRIKAPRKMGKTQLMGKILDYSATQGYRTVSVDLLQPDESVLIDLEKFLHWLCANVSYQLDMPNKIPDFWDGLLGSNASCDCYFKEYILPQGDPPLVLALDNVDRIFDRQNIASDFFKLLRSWFEGSRTKDILKKLRLVVAHSTEIYLSLDINHSPFNVGLAVELPEFTVEQVTELAKQQGLDLNPNQIEELMSKVGGHPYLVREAFDRLEEYSGMTLAQILEKAETEEGVYANHLRELSDSLFRDSRLVSAMKAVVQSDKPVELERKRAFQLQSMGLVRWRGNAVEPCNQLYSSYFRDRLEGMQ